MTISPDPQPDPLPDDPSVTGWLNLAFGSVPLTLSQWAMCVAMASGVLWFCELCKAFSRWRDGQAAPTPAA